MGSLNAEAFADAVEDGSVSLPAAVSWHLSANHYPPIPSSMVPVCVAAIEAASDNEWERPIDLPPGITWRDRDTAPAWAVIEGHHLDAFIR